MNDLVHARSVLSSSLILRTITRQAALSMGFFRQEYWSGLPFPPAGDLPHPGTDLRLLSLLNWQVDALSPGRL